MEPIQIKIEQYTKEEIRESVRGSVRMNRTNSAVYYIAAPILIFVGIVGLIVNEAWLIAALVCGVYLLLILHIGIYRAVQKSKKLTAQSVPIEIEIDEKGIHIITATGNTGFSVWQSFSVFMSKSDLFLIKIKNNNHVIVIPKKYLNSDQIVKLNKLLTEKLKKY